MLFPANRRDRVLHLGTRARSADRLSAQPSGHRCAVRVSALYVQSQVAGGVVGDGSAVVVDDLDVVCVGVQDERAVVARVVDGALAGAAVVRVARGERGGVERPHGRVVLRREREVDVLRERPLVVDQREAEVLGISATGAGVPSVRMKPSNPATCVTSRKRASSELTMNVCGTSRGPNTKEPAGATTVSPATQIVSSPSRT